MILLSLVGEQPLPNLLPIRYLHPGKVLLVYTDKTLDVARRLRRIVSGTDQLDRDLKTAAFDFDATVRQLRQALPTSTEVVFNLTGGTKLMALAAFALAAERQADFIYLDSEAGRNALSRYRFEGGAAVLTARPVQLPPLITAADYLNAHWPGYTEEGPNRDKATGQLSVGGQFEQVVADTLRADGGEVLSGVRPQGVGEQIEIDLVIRYGNQVGIAEVKLGLGMDPKKGLDQIKMAGEQTFMGTYTAEFLIAGVGHVQPKIQTLAEKRDIEIIRLKGYTPGCPLPPAEAERLTRTIRRRLGA